MNAIEKRGALEGVLCRARSLMLGISSSEASFDRRGFRKTSLATVSHLEKVALTFIAGYMSGVGCAAVEGLRDELETFEPEFKGFAYEGAAMAVGLLDMLSPWPSNRFSRFATGVARDHVYMAHVGAGWAVARLPMRRSVVLRQADPLLKGLLFDGLGFHNAYFHPHKYVHGQVRPDGLSPCEGRAVDQGAGRALWFIEGGEPEAVACAIDRFSTSRQTDLWSGVGLAATYAGGVPASAYDDLKRLGAAYAPFMAQGAAFAAKARQRGGNPTSHTEAACRSLCGAAADDMAALTDAVLDGLSLGGDGTDYEAWREGVQRYFE